MVLSPEEATRYNLGMEEMQAELEKLEPIPDVEPQKGAVKGKRSNIPPFEGAIRWGNGWVTPERALEIKEKQSGAGKDGSNRQKIQKEIQRLGKEEMLRRLKEPQKVISDEERDRLQKATYREKVEWVLEHLYCGLCPKNLPGQVEALWRSATGRRKAFVDKFLPMLCKSDKPDEGEVDEGADASLELLADMVKKFEGVCPHCGRGGQ